jgi:hypothetical protein
MMQIFPNHEFTQSQPGSAANSALSSSPSSFSPPSGNATAHLTKSSSSGSNTGKKEGGPEQPQEKNNNNNNEDEPTRDRRFEGISSPREHFRRKSLSEPPPPKGMTSPQTEGPQMMMPLGTSGTSTPLRSSFHSNVGVGGSGSGKHSPTQPLRKSFLASATVHPQDNDNNSPSKKGPAPIRKSFTVGISTPQGFNIDPNLLASFGGGSGGSPDRARSATEINQYQQQQQQSHHYNRLLLHTKTLSQTTRDQQYLLSQQDYSNAGFKYLHKLVFLITQAYSLLAKDNFTIACLGITGLTKLAIKNTMSSLIDIDDSLAQRSDRLIGVASDRKERRKSSFMVATNSLSESPEEGILIDVKTELNNNKWNKLLSFGDILASSLQFSNDSVSKISKIGRGMSSSYSRSRLRTDSGSVKNLLKKQGSGEDNNADAVTLRINHSNSGSLKEDTNANNSNNNGTMFPAIISSGPTTPKNEQKAALLKQKSEEKRYEQDKEKEKEKEKEETAESQQSKPDEIKPLISFPANTQGRKSFVAGGKKAINFRANSLKQTSDVDYVKSKRMAANLVAQLLLDFLETRKDCVFNEEIIDSLIQLWKENTEINLGPGKNSHFFSDRVLLSFILFFVFG